MWPQAYDGVAEIISCPLYFGGGMEFLCFPEFISLSLFPLKCNMAHRSLHFERNRPKRPYLSERRREFGDGYSFTATLRRRDVIFMAGVTTHVGEKRHKGADVLTFVPKYLQRLSHLGY